MSRDPSPTLLPDPYSPGQVPRQLAGRAVELGRIRDRLARVATYGELGGPVLVFHAPRGLGKTSLLRASEREAQSLGFASAWVACSRERAFLPELVRSVDLALERVDLEPTSRRRWRDRVRKVSVQLGVLGFSVAGEVDTTGAREGQPEGSAPIGAVEELLHGAASAVRGRGGAGLVVYLDELHAASADDTATLLNALQNLDGSSAENPLTVITAGLPITPEALTRAATFGERSDFVPLDVLSDQDARALLEVPAAALDVTWDAAALAAVLERSAGHPYLLQLVGSCTWQMLAPAAGTRIDLDAVTAGAPRADQQLAGMYVARWGAASALERSFLSAMAATGADNVARADIAAGMGRDSRAISVPRERLIDKGVIEPVGHGLVRFTLPGFGAWVGRRDEV